VQFVSPLIALQGAKMEFQDTQPLRTSLLKLQNSHSR
jgi:hypothetical protein